MKNFISVTFRFVFFLFSTSFLPSCADSPEDELEKASKQNTIQSYQEFIEKFPNSNLRKSAEEKLDRLQWSKYFEVEYSPILTGGISMILKEGGYDKNGSRIVYNSLCHKTDSIVYQLFLAPGTETIGIDSNSVNKQNSQELPGYVPRSLPPYFDGFPLVFDGNYKMTGMILKQKEKWNEKYDKMRDSLNLIIKTLEENKKEIPSNIINEKDRLLAIYALDKTWNGLQGDKFFVIRKIEYLSNSK